MKVLLLLSRSQRRQNSVCWAGFNTRSPICPSTTSARTGATERRWEHWWTAAHQVCARVLWISVALVGFSRCVLPAVLFCVSLPGLCPDWETWDPVKPVENATEAMQLADDWLGIPQVRNPCAVLAWLANDANVRRLQACTHPVLSVFALQRFILCSPEVRGHQQHLAQMLFGFLTVGSRGNSLQQSLLSTPCLF